MASLVCQGVECSFTSGHEEALDDDAFGPEI